MNIRLSARTPAGSRPGPDLHPSPAAARRPPPRIAVHTAMALRRALLAMADRMMPAHAAVLEHAHQFTKAHLLSCLAELQITLHFLDEALQTRSFLPAGASPRGLVAPPGTEDNGRKILARLENRLPRAAPREQT